LKLLDKDNKPLQNKKSKQTIKIQKTEKEPNLQEKIEKIQKNS
jgi:hypothetical protein